MLGLPFRQVWFLDTEFRQASRDHPDLPDLPEVVCLVGRELGSNRLIRLWGDQLGPEPPFPSTNDALFVAFQASAEWGVFGQLGWKLPTRVLDLYLEFLHETNDGRPRAKGTTSLLAALSAHGVGSITSEQKAEERELILRGGPWTGTERRRILDYCQTDVDPLAALLERMLPRIRTLPKGFEHAIIRGQYSVTEARMNHTGIPIDAELNGLISHHKQSIRHDLIGRVDTGRYNVYRDGEFKYGLFKAYLHDHKMDWPRTASGQPELKDKTFKDMCLRYPEMEDLRQLYKSLKQLAGKDLLVGRDGRSRPWLKPFRTLTGRHNPSSSDFIFGRAAWMRGLVKPPEGRSLAYLDWRSQEVFIAAKLSGDKQLLEAVQRSDVYLELAVAAGIAPPGATKQSHPSERELAKTCFLGVGYGMQPPGLAMRTGLTSIEAENLVRSLARMFPDFYEWADRTVDVGQMYGYLTSVFGWTFQTGDAKANTIRNFPVQANGAEMCRLACRYATEAGVDVCCPVHDAILIEANTGEFDDSVAAARSAMAKASRAVLDGVEVDTELDLAVHWPGRLLPERGRGMWDLVMDSLARQTGLLREDLEGSKEGKPKGKPKGGVKGLLISSAFPASPPSYWR
jgi:hypothetical protein